MQPGSARFVRDSDLRAEPAQEIEGASFGGARVRGRQHAQLTSRLAVTTQRVHQRGNAAASDERHHDVDAIGGVDLCQNLVTDSRFPWCVGKQRRVEERDQRLWNGFGRSIGLTR